MMIEVMMIIQYDTQPSNTISPLPLLKDILYAPETILDKMANSQSADFSCNNQ